MPNNIAKHNLSRSGISNNALHDDKQAPSKLDYISDPVSISSSDSQTALLWQKVGERECVLSLIEFDMRPPSPINLRLSIDNALHHGQLIAGAVFTPPPPSWTQMLHSAKLKRLAPSVHCGSNQMTLSVKRRGTHHFLIDSGEEPLTPLSQMPSTCGFFVKRSRRDVQYAASYQGCHVNKQGNEYSLPLRLWGEPMTMSCPGMVPLPSIFCFPDKMVVTIRGVPANELKVKGSPPLLPHFYLFPGSESPAHPHRVDTHTSRLWSPQTSLSLYPVPLFQEFPMMPGVFLPTTTPVPLPATSTEAVVTTPAPTGNEKPYLQPEFPALLQYPFAPFSKYPQSPREQTAADAESKPQHLHPRVFQIPMLYPFNHFPQLQNAPAPVASTDPPPPEKPLYQQHPVIPPYMFPSRFPYLHFFNSPVMTSSYPAPSGQQQHQPVYHSMQAFYPFLPDQSRTAPKDI
uniref:Uncharacterized LOC103465133 n=1 Tax=Poecilia reticulata TaxID=8081 RepID=A0A3P9NFT4_POERE